MCALFIVAPLAHGYGAVLHRLLGGGGDMKMRLVSEDHSQFWQEWF
jgi:hypothetical protein